MGTRSMTYFVEDHNVWAPSVDDESKHVGVKLGVRPFVALYRQMDGYPEGHGVDLAGFLASGDPSHGISPGATRRQFNGMDDLAAQTVAYMKTQGGGGDGEIQVGNFYVMHPDTKDVGEEYVYTVSMVKGVIQLTVDHFGTFFFGMGGQSAGERNHLFEGTPEQFLEWNRVQKEAAQVEG